MKTSSSVRRLHADLEALNLRLQIKVDDLVTSLIEKKWHYESRVKSLESFALKLQTGRVDNPSDLEDFFACTIVVPTLIEAQAAESLVRNHFELRSRRPESAELAAQPAHVFQYDHTRLYMRLRPGIGMRQSPIHDLRFEVQIKTFFQHAWSLGTHDLTYKTATPDWGKQRLAAQVKAMLEVAEVAISEANVIASSGAGMAKRDERIDDLKQAIETLTVEFGAGDLPDDLQRLAECVLLPLKLAKLSSSDLKGVLSDGRSRNGGSHPSDLSPFATVVQYLLDVRPAEMKAALRKQQRQKIILEPNLKLPAGLDLSICQGAVVLS